MRPQIQSRIVAIEQYIVRASGKDVPEDLQGSLARFGTVLLCGFIERSVEIIIMDRLANRAHGRVLSFVKSHFQRGTNYDCEAISQLLERFDVVWCRKFRTFIDGNDDLRVGVSSMYGVRNSVAHGGSSSVGLIRLQELFAASQRLVHGLEEATD